MGNKDIPWNVWAPRAGYYYPSDGQLVPMPVLVVFAPGWYEARNLAADLLAIHTSGLHVQQLSDREMRDGKIAQEVCYDCSGAGVVFQHYGPDQYDFDAVDCDSCDGKGRS